MSLECPNCGPNLQPHDFEIEWGNWIRCLSCGADLRYTIPYHYFILILSAPILIFELWLGGFEQDVVTKVMMVVFWFVGSLWLAATLFVLVSQKLRLAQTASKVRSPVAHDAKG
jgi:hypothetical protein